VIQFQTKIKIVFFVLILAMSMVAGFVQALRERPRAPANFDQLQGLKAISKNDPWDKKMRLMAEQEIIDSWTGFKVPLDFSDGSIQALETVLDRMTRSPQIQSFTEKDLRAEALIAGAYVGEVIRRNHLGVWAIDSETAAELSFPMKHGSGEEFPCTWCYKRLKNGPEDNIWDKYRIFVLGETNVSGDYTITHETNMGGLTKTNVSSTNLSQ